MLAHKLCRLLPAGLMVLLFVAGPARAEECQGGGGQQGSGGIILKTITCEGDPSDWTEILANPVQVTVDGDGSSMDCSVSADKDCPVGQVGRDMNRFTWTYDATNLYLFQSRYGSTSNIQTFFFYMDVGLDRFMDLADFVVRVDYQGSNRSTKVRLYRFVPRDGVTPDPMECPAGNPTCTEGYADGYNMPGGYTPISDPACFLCTQREHAGGFNRSGAGSYLDGEGFEVYVPWADLGFSAPQPIYFHVAGTGPSGIILDNCGSPDGRIGTFGFHGVDLEASQGTSLARAATPTTVSYAHTVRNTGMFEGEVINLVATSTLGLRLDYWDITASSLMATDLAGDGIFTDPGDYLDPAYDADSNGQPDTRALARYNASNPATTFHLRLDVTLPSVVVPCADETSLFARIADSAVFDCVKDTTTVGDVEFGAALSLVGMPGAPVNFAHAARHFLAADRINLSGVSSRGWSLSFYADPGGDGDPSGDPLMGIDANGDGDFSDVGDYLDPAYDTDGDGFPDTGVLTPGTPFPFVLQVAGAGSVGDADAVTLTGRTGPANGYMDGSVQDALSLRNRLTLTPTHQVYGPSGRSIFLGHRVENAHSEPDSALLSHVLHQDGSPVSWTVRYWTDPDCDGSIADGSQLVAVAPETRPETPAMSASGGTTCIVVEVAVPSSAPDGASVQLQLTATSKQDGGTPPASAVVQDTVALSKLVTCKDGFCTEPAVAFSTCDAVYARGYNWRAGDTYVLHFRSPSGADRSGPRPVAVNGLGEFLESYALQSGDEAGSWKVQLFDEADVTLIKELTISVVVLAPAVTGPAAICPRQSAVLEADAGYASYLWSPGGQTTSTIVVSPDATTVYTCTVTDSGGCQATAPAHTVTVNPCANLLRNAEVTQLSPQSPPNSSIFQVGDPSLVPARDDEALGFVAGAAFAHDVADLDPASSPLIFYEVENVSGSSLRVAKSGGRVVITF